MRFVDAVREILSSAIGPLTPQEIRDHIKEKYSEFYATPSHVRNVEKGHYKDTDHALLAQIYNLVGMKHAFFCDKSFKPMRIALRNEERQTEIVHRPLRRMVRLPRETLYEKKVEEILVSADKYHDAFYKAEPFRGPSLYFHRRSLESRHSHGFIAHLEYIYATLASWGMHRMGSGGSKMRSFDVFRRSVEPLKEKILEAERIDPESITESNWLLLEAIFRSIKIMASGTTLVGNSKVMAHMMPNIVPPIDREYTLRFLEGNTNISNDLNYEWDLMKGIISHFFIPVANATGFSSLVQNWISDQENYPWDTSVFKVIDNLVVGAIRWRSEQNGSSRKRKRGQNRKKSVE